jgi:hypothetical protein
MSRVRRGKTVFEKYQVLLARDTETGVVVGENWFKEGAPRGERYIRRDWETGEITSERFRAGGLKTTQQYGPQRQPKVPGAPKAQKRQKTVDPS